ncbi:murein biosynthesis integral membrane protein MurJ [Ferrimonas balearica]|uniref:murein biosynthesis integral membrane protein MurJ n=1 Tax=Ferrimonas balearica TaxID=44012 RepID=UPI001C99516D|nr:murein biosynthesis integral membrane protein MurJ [Ferrimonas balearica]MBY5922815.1 murein biosynthesis integral membrane protein MurJ [Ferrimonas balearica]MBY5997808.1 murein biosynthesis integral membrane protein MurJ [Ferrimonas balearica]
MSKRLVRSGLIVSAMTLVSRVLGLVRDVVVAGLMGAGAAADVFFLANKIPNFLRRLFAEGAFAQAFVPVLTEYQQQREPDEVRELIAKVSGTLGGIVTLVTLFGVVASPVLAALFGTGWFVAWLGGEPEGAKFLLASLMLKITFPYLWFITLTALAGAILNTLGRFAVAAFTPVFLNVAIIACALWLSPQLERPELGLAWGVFFGGLIQFLFQIPFLYRANMLVRPQWGWHHPGVKKIRTLMIPAMFGVSVSQINLLFDTLIASFLMTGSISWLYYSDRLLEFPLGLFGIAIATVILPALSKDKANDDPARFGQTLDWGVRSVLMVGIPAMLGLMVLAQPMLMVLFMRGEFSVTDTQMAAMSLLAYASGLLSFMLVKVLAPGYYARQDTKTPVRYGIIAMIANMAFNLALAIPFGYVGLALATSASATLNAFLLYRGLHRQGVYQLSGHSLGQIARMALAGAVMAVTLIWLTPNESGWLAMAFMERVVTLFGLIGLGAVTYGLSLLVFGLRPRQLKSL